MVAILELGSSFAEEETGALRILHGKKEIEGGIPPETLQHSLIIAAGKTDFPALITLH